VSLREAGPADAGFLQELDADVRAPLFGHLSPPMRAGLLEQQYSALRHGRAQRHPEALEQVVLLGGRPVGAVVTELAPGVLELIDIALLSGERGRGVGTTVLEHLIRHASERRRAIRASVYRTNPRAHALYQRLGFRDLKGDELLIRIERPSTGASDTS
jgi:ribosomal protein S18 acetylase RimI-like enzyme